MKVPCFDIRSHFLLWMILSKVFSMYINADRHFGIRSLPCWLQRRKGLVANMPRLHAVFSSGFPRALKKKQWLRESALRAMEILVYWHIFRRKHGRFQMQMSEHKMYLIFCLYKLERLQVNTNPKNWINFVWTVQLLPFSISFSFCPFFFG